MTKSVVFIFVFVVLHVTTGYSSAEPVVSKKGLCRMVEESDRNCNREFVSECLVDFDCNGTAKCCRTACRQYRCVEPVNLGRRMCHRFSDIAFVLDASGSIGKESFEKSKRVIKKVLQTFAHEKGYRHATVVYGKKPSLVFNNIATWDNGIRTGDLLALVDKIPYANSRITRINAALRLVMDKVFPFNKNQKPRTKIVVLFTDGVQSTPPYRKGLEKAGKQLEKNNIKVFGVLSGELGNIRALLELCSNGQLIFKPEFLAEMMKDMYAEMDYPC